MGSRCSKDRSATLSVKSCTNVSTHVQYPKLLQRFSLQVQRGIEYKILSKLNLILYIILKFIHFIFLNFYGFYNFIFLNQLLKHRTQSPTKRRFLLILLFTITIPFLIQLFSRRIIITSTSLHFLLQILIPISHSTITRR